MQEITDELKQINKTLCGILNVIEKPQKSKIMQVFELIGAGVGILGIVVVADIIRKWIMGG